MRTLIPLIVTARVLPADMYPFDVLREKHFPPDRNHLAAHLTMFHRLPGEQRSRIVEFLTATCQPLEPFTADVTGVRHLGAGVAFNIECPALQTLRDHLKSAFVTWLSSQDMQKWHPHITIQNKVSKAAANNLYHEISHTFRRRQIEIIGVDLWRYLGGPWQHEAAVGFMRSDRAVGLT